MAYEQVEHLVWVDQHVVTLRDADGDWDGRWKNDAFGKERGIGLAEGVISVVDFARAAGGAPLLFEIHSDAPAADDVDDYEGVVEASIHLPSRTISVENERGRVATVLLPSAPGDDWRARVYFANGNTARGDYADGGEHVRIALFPAAAAAVDVTKPRTLDGEVVRTYEGTRTEAELLSMLRGPNVSHRCLAAVALLQTGKLEPVVAAASEPSSVRRVFASTVWFAGAPAEAILVELAKDADPDIRTRAAQSIGFLRARALRSIVEAMRSDPESSVRRAADGALEDLE